MDSYIYTCSACKGYSLYAPSGLPADLGDSITCARCGRKLEKHQMEYNSFAAFRAVKSY